MHLFILQKAVNESICGIDILKPKQKLDVA